MTAVLGEGVHAVHLTTDGVLLVDGVPVPNEQAPRAPRRATDPPGWSVADMAAGVCSWAQPTPRELPVLVFPAPAPDPDAVLRQVS